MQVQKERKQHGSVMDDIQANPEYIRGGDCSVLNNQL